MREIELKMEVNEMDIDRNVNQEDLNEAIKRVGFCLDRLEESKRSDIIFFKGDFLRNLSIEEMIGALVIAEQKLKELEDIYNEEWKEDKWLIV